MHLLRLACCLGVLAVLTADLRARAETVTLTPTKDNTLFSTEGTTSNGAGEAIFSGRTGSAGGGTRQRAVLAFDVAGNIPAGATITSVSLTLTLIQFPAQAVAETHTLHLILADWGEGTSSAFGGSGGASTPGDATWLHTFYPNQFWTSEGGDFSATSSAAQIVNPNIGSYTWGSTAPMVADVQGWLDDPSTNFGWLLMGNEQDFYTARKFASKEHADSGSRPMLTIQFTPGCPDDGLFCNGAEIPGPSQGCTSAGNPCPPGTFCNENTDACDDCIVAPDCDDGVACTVDACSSGNCVITPIDANCAGDGLFCNGVESCNVLLGCVSSGNPCPPAEACNEAADTCDACTAAADCDDGVFCNGAEVCNPQSGSCSAGEAPCSSLQCDEDADACVECLADADCDDGLFCNGAEFCDPQSGLCREGGDPCLLLLCDEADDACVECLADSDCDDGSFCNGAETCVEFACRPGGVPCTQFESCDEDADLCEPAEDDGEPNEPAQPTDDDGDTVSNDEDQCPGTPAGEIVDELGCSESQTAEQPQPEPDTEPTASCGSDMCGALSMMNLALMIAASIAMRTSRRSRSARRAGAEDN